MKKTLTTSLFFLFIVSVFGQEDRKVSTYLSAQFNQTIYDITARNNPWGVGLGLQAQLNNKTKFKPVVEFSALTYFAGYKDLYLIEGRDVSVSGMVNAFAGASFHPTSRTHISFLIGTSFINGNACLGIKPSVGFYFSKNQRWTGDISFINVFNREPSIEKDFGSLNLSIGLKLF